MNSDQQKILNEMIKENNTQDNTQAIRDKKHSELIRKDISKIQNLKRKLKTKDFRTLDNEASKQCGFLFTFYQNIYNKLLKDEINIKIMYSFLDELEGIEKGKQTQHEASYKIGMLLKQLYIDKKIDTKLEEKHIKNNEKKQSSVILEKPKKISYEEYLKLQQNNNN